MIVELLRAQMFEKVMGRQQAANVFQDDRLIAYFGLS
ncbi:hypothetical protein HK44_002890 [Pseudomonas fluorescens HK44]|uniref:Uncharacterized protein n=1 Tax=Pseudomonas fluorescens HK44 TaxID=1042209 RepID=A0A010T9K9_PSEFL|nr:hypothetical protein HK44_002890 [Pseudomonas fluorescens HK44]